MPRVSYSAPVRLSGEWSDREPWFVPLLAQSLDLSEGGMALVTPLRLQIGAAVTCSMRLGGRQAYFVGRVVWDHTAADGTKRVGIQFLSPSDEDTGVMRRLLAIGQSHPHRVNLRFDGRPDTLTALARVTRSGLTLTAPLPILRRDTAVRFAFEELGPTFDGRVERVRLSHQHGMPALRVGIRVCDASKAHPAPSPTPRPESRVRAFSQRLRQRSASALSPASLGLALCALAIGALAHGVLQHSQQAPVATPASPPVQLRAPHSSASTAQAGTAVAVSQAQAANESCDQNVPTLVAHADEHDGEQTAASFQPAFKWRHDRRELFLPFAGSLAGLRHFRIDSPPGIAIDLPVAEAPQAALRYPVLHPGVNRIDITPWQRPSSRAQAGSRIRIWTDGAVAAYRIETTATGVRVTLPGEPTVDR